MNPITAEISEGLTGGLADLCMEADLIVSANMLSQIPIVPINRYEVRGREAPPRLGAQLIATHLAALDALAWTAGRVCLITDTVQRAEDRDGRVTDSLDLMFGVAPPRPAFAWDWEIAPCDEIDRRRRLIHRVHAYPEWHVARV